jgi:plasmid stabilization system protein ParE
MVERIFAHSERLEAHPRLGPVVSEYDDETLRELFEDPYRIVYRLVEGRIDVVAVVHASRRMPRGL